MFKKKCFDIGITLDTFSSDQITAIQTIIEGRDRIVIISGAAGTGKSHVLRACKHYYDEYPEEMHLIEMCDGQCHFANRSAAIVAPTGCAAINVGGITIDSFLGGKSSTRRTDHINRKVDANRHLDFMSMYNVIMPTFKPCDISNPVLFVDEMYQCNFALLCVLFASCLPCQRIIGFGDEYQLSPVFNHCDFILTDFIREFKWKYFEIITIVRTQSLVRLYTLS